MMFELPLAMNAVAIDTSSPKNVAMRPIRT